MRGLGFKPLYLHLFLIPILLLPFVLCFALSNKNSHLHVPDEVAYERDVDSLIFIYWAIS